MIKKPNFLHITYPDILLSIGPVTYSEELSVLRPFREDLDSERGEYFGS